MTNIVNGAAQEWRFGKTDGFPDGPWTSEPDKVHWIDKATDLDCLIVRNRSGALCGYVGLPPGHRLHGKGYSECLADDCGAEWCYEHSPDCAIDVHGGLTFSDSCDEQRPEGICHVPAEGRPKNVWWFGFDCAHYRDLTPGEVKTAIDHNFQYPFSDPRKDGESVYRDVAYVQAECTSLARQLADAS